MKRTAVVGGICLLLGCVVGSAQGKYTVYGHGTQSCGAWSAAGTAVRDRDPLGASKRYEQEAWILGFISGAGYANASVLRKTDSSGTVAWMDTYCAAHPLDSIGTAAEKLFNELRTP
jgi:hypothetical protein